MAISHMTSADQAPRPPRKSAVAKATAQIEPGLPEALAHAITALREEDFVQAEPRLQAILARWPEQPDALHFLGVLRHTEGRRDEAIELIRRAIAALPGMPGMWNNLGNVLVGAERLPEAAAAYERSIELAGDSDAAAEALNNLGTLHRKQHQLPEAEAACRRATALRPDFAPAWYNLSQCLMTQGRVHEGLVANSRAITLLPRHLMARDQVLRALLLLGERERAAQLYRDWLAEDPDNPVIQHQLAACLGDQTPERASDAYVEQVFDSFAQSFDVKLEKLHYRAPALVTEAVQRALGEGRSALDIVDLGCGTGLCGPLVKPWARHLAGCDLSVGMLRQARQRKVYDVLHKAELVHYLDTQPGRFDLAISADTLCYFGELTTAMRASARSLRAGGCLVFTVEALADDRGMAHLLQTSGRYAHGRAHVRAALDAAALTVSSIDAVELRTEAGMPVNGWLVTARKP